MAGSNREIFLCIVSLLFIHFFCFNTAHAAIDLIDNGSFTNSLSSWKYKECCGAQVAITVDSGVFKAAVVDAGARHWDAQLFQGDLRIVQGLVYTLRFEARAERRRLIEAVVETDGAPWARYSKRRIYQLTPEAFVYEHTFTMDSVSDQRARIAFSFGKDPGLVVIDNVRLFQHNSRFALVNGDFSGIAPYAPMRPIPLYGWDTRVCCEANAQLRVSGGECEANIAEGGAAAWAIQLLQRGFYLAYGKRYTLRFDARARADRAIEVVVETDGDPWINYGETRVYQITPMMRSYTHTFTMQDSTDPAARLTFNLGGHDADVVIDNVSLSGDERELYPLTVKGGDWSGLATGSGLYPRGYSAYIHCGTMPRESLFLTWAGDTGVIAAPSQCLTMLRMPERAVTVEALTAPAVHFDFSVAGEGAVYTNPPGERAPGEIDRDFPRGANVTIEATAAAGYMFSRWTGEKNGKNNPLVLRADSHYSLTAHFITGEENLVANGTFSAGAEGWQFYEMDGGQGDTLFGHGECALSITNAGGTEWALQFFQKKITIEQGARYQLSFSARASAVREIRAHVQKAGPPWTSYSSDGRPQRFALSTQWETFEIDFTMRYPTQANARVIFELGQETATVFIDDVRLIKK